MMRKIVYLILVFLFLAGGVVVAQTLEEVIAKNLEAKGGYEKIKSITSEKVMGKVNTQGMEIPYTLIKKRPHFFRMEATVQGQTMVRAYDGKTAWWIFPFMGDPTPQKMPEDQAKEVIEQADFDGPLVDYQQKGHKLELMGKEDMEGTEVYKLKLTKKNGDIQYWYLDAEYFIELKVTSKRKQKDTEVEVETYFSDYKDVDGLMIPHTIESKMGGVIANQVVVDSITTNVEVDTSIFKMPEEPKSEEKK